MVVEKLSVYILGYELENLCVVVHQVELIVFGESALVRYYL